VGSTRGDEPVGSGDQDATMKTFKSVVLSKHPVEQLWILVRDEMPALATSLDDIERVTVIERRQGPRGRLRLVNEWCAKPQLPIPLKPLIGADSLLWLDRAEWIDVEKRCAWSIEPRFLPGRIQCHGSTQYAAAMGGRGARITFEGELDVTPGPKGGATRLLEQSIMPIVESVVTVMIPRNFRRIVEAADRRLNGEART